MTSDASRQTSKKSLYVGIGVAVVLIVLISWAFVISQQHTANTSAAALAAQSDSEKAYENIVRDSLNAYHSRYSKYPSDYQTLLDDMTKTPDLYGVNSEGLSELKEVDARLSGFSYGKMNDDNYLFTYQEINSGETISVTNK
jgi:hypothetical protein